MAESTSKQPQITNSLSGFRPFSLRAYVELPDTGDKHEERAAREEKIKFIQVEEERESERVFAKFCVDPVRRLRPLSHELARFAARVFVQLCRVATNDGNGREPSQRNGTPRKRCVGIFSHLTRVPLASLDQVRLGPEPRLFARRRNRARLIHFRFRLRSTIANQDESSIEESASNLARGASR